MIIKTYVATDLDANDGDADVVDWQGNDAGDFTITKNRPTDTVELKFAGTSPNFEMPSQTPTPTNDYEIRVKVKDDGIPGQPRSPRAINWTTQVTIVGQRCRT